MLMSCRLSGMAMKTPRNDTAASHAMISHHSNCRPVTSVRAGMAETSPADAM